MFFLPRTLRFGSGFVRGTINQAASYGMRRPDAAARRHVWCAEPRSDLEREQPDRVD